MTTTCDALREERRYVTRSRERIVDLMRRERRYLSASAIVRALSDRGRRTARSTVYRTLDLLVSLGLAAKRTESDGEQAYVLCPSVHHHHAICRSCGIVEDVECAAVERFSERLRDRHGFILDDHALEFFGRCAACA